MPYLIRRPRLGGRRTVVSYRLRSAFLALAAGAVAALAASLPVAAASFWTNTASPAIPSIPGSPFELGVKFQSDTAGYITALRFYKCSANTGRHVGHLWSSTGTLLATAVFTSETASGWQQVTLSTPVAIQAHTTYVASYWDPTGYHSANRYYFKKTYNKPPLHALGDGVSGANGVYRMGSSGFPTLTSESSNYWVDVVFTPGSPGASLWSNATAPALMTLTGSAFELGVKFQSDAAGYITALRFYKCTANTGRHVGHLWSSTGTLLASAVFTSETASGWQQVTLSTPVAIHAHTTYVASYWDPTGYHSANRYYFQKTYNKPPLHALGDGVSGANGVYRMGSSGFPTLTSESSNYWVDVVFTPSSPAGSPPTPTRLLSATPASLNFGNTTIGTSSTLPVVLKNTGSASLNISLATVTGAGFRLSGALGILGLAAGQNTSLSVVFAPAAAGNSTGSVLVVSTASNSPVVVALSGVGAGPHSVRLSWSPSRTGGVVGYNIYRATSSGGPYSRLNPSLIAGTAYTDRGVQVGQRYYYVSTAMTSGSIESPYSNQGQATVPGP